MQKCFNGHRGERHGCAGCHHAFHVVELGKVAGGRLVPPVVSGPRDCDLCHGARHQEAVPGCPQCEATFAEILEGAMDASQPVRTEVLQLHFLHWFVGWQARVAGWFCLMAGVTLGDWFQRSNGSQDWLKALLSFAAIPLVQWGIRKRISQRERLLPRLGPKGEIVYGSDGDSGA